MFFEDIKRYWEMGLYNVQNLDLFVQVNYMSQDEYNELVGVQDSTSNATSESSSTSTSVSA